MTAISDTLALSNYVTGRRSTHTTWLIKYIILFTRVHYLGEPTKKRPNDSQRFPSEWESSASNRWNWEKGSKESIASTYITSADSKSRTDKFRRSMKYVVKNCKQRNMDDARCPKRENRCSALWSLIRRDARRWPINNIPSEYRVTDRKWFVSV